MKAETRTPLRYRKLGWLMMGLGVVLTVLFWALLLPVVKRQDPSLDPRLSLAGFWEEKQQALNLGLMIYHDAWFIGSLGDKAWTEKVIRWVAEGRQPLLGHGISPEQSLPYLTNQEICETDEPTTGWESWWKKHQGQTQEQWIQEGFKQRGFEISLPPTQADWPKLLSLLGATAGPYDFAPVQTMEMIYPEHLRYNAYRWLRDSAFEPIRYLADQAERPMSGEESGGLIEYQNQKTEFERMISPLPGKMAFADHEWSGLLTLDGGIHLSPLVFPIIQTAVTLSFVALFLFGYSMACRRKAVAKLVPQSQPRIIKRCIIGRLLFAGGILGPVFHWLLAVPWLQGKAPDYTPHLSVQGYWESKQPHLKWGRWWHEDGNVVGTFGDKEWAERLMRWMASGREMESCQNGHWEDALPLITNHDLSFSNSGHAWKDWWKAHKYKPQEQWIQDGFNKLGFDVRLPPTQGDWPQLLALMGTTAGPEPVKEDGSVRSQQWMYPFHTQYNAYRWLRDCGFEPIAYVLGHRGKISGEALSGIRRYWEIERDILELFTAPYPGRLAFTPEPTWGFSQRLIFNGPPFELSAKFQLSFMGACAFFCLIGWLLARPRPQVF